MQVLQLHARRSSLPSPVRAAPVACPHGGLSAELELALAEEGWRLERVREDHAPLGARHAFGVLEVCPDGADELARAASWSSAAPGVPLVLRVDGALESVLRACLELTPHVHAASLPAWVVARSLTRLSQAAAAPAARGVRRVAIRPWEGLEVDGREIYLGTAERNFLYLLASGSGTRIWKHDDVPSGAGRTVRADHCRRRLGERLGPELASLLVASERGDAYRLRRPEEVADLSRGAASAHVPTELRVPGRAQVAASSRRLDPVA